jgi:hypothetical protein
MVLVVEMIANLVIHANAGTLDRCGSWDKTILLSFSIALDPKVWVSMSKVIIWTTCTYFFASLCSSSFVLSELLSPASGSAIPTLGRCGNFVFFDILVLHSFSGLLWLSHSEEGALQRW